MYTECPSCQTYFKITPNQLKAAKGKVRCGTCDEVFDALSSLVDVVPSSDIEDATSASEPVADENLSRILSEPDLSDLPASQIENSAIDDSVIQNSDIDSNVGIQDTAKASSDFSDIELPDGITDTQPEMSLEPTSETLDIPQPSTIEPEAVSNSQRQEINDDIDAALDDLFKEDDLEVKSKVESEASGEASSVDNNVSTISELDELAGLDFDAPKSEAVADELVITEPFVEGPASIRDEDNSLLQVEKDLQANGFKSKEAAVDNKATADNKTAESQTAAANSDFDLGDSFVISELETSAPEDWDKSSKEKTDVEGFSADSYVLEELEDGNSSNTGRLVRFLWVALILMLLVFLLGQFAYLKREDLARYPSIKPIIVNMCAELNAIVACEIPPARDIEAIKLLERNVVSHPNAKNALLITSKISNEAEFDQPYPDLILTFSDINQKVIAERRFKPKEYLSKEVDIKKGMEKNLPIKLMLEIVDPGEDAVNFEFSFQ